MQEIYPIQSGKLYAGRVIENNDPEKRGRVKVEIDLLTKDIKVDNKDATDDQKKEILPWYVVLPSPSSGNNQSISVPSLNTLVFVSFPNSDIYNGVVVHSFSDLKADKT